MYVTSIKESHNILIGNEFWKLGTQISYWYFHHPGLFVCFIFLKFNLLYTQKYLTNLGLFGTYHFLCFHIETKKILHKIKFSKYSTYRETVEISNHNLYNHLTMTIMHNYNLALTYLIFFAAYIILTLVLCFKMVFHFWYFI